MEKELASLKLTVLVMASLKLTVLVMASLKELA
jgi:hypothetical protein